MDREASPEGGQLCPVCKSGMVAAARECPACRADLSLLADCQTQVDAQLIRAATLTRAGELGEAVSAYLLVLAADPQNAIACRHVGLVAAAVRQFDQEVRRGYGTGGARDEVVPGSKGPTPASRTSSAWPGWLVGAGLVLAFVSGWVLGHFAPGP